MVYGFPLIAKELEPEPQPCSVVIDTFLSITLLYVTVNGRLGNRRLAQRVRLCNLSGFGDGVERKQGCKPKCWKLRRSCYRATACQLIPDILQRMGI